MTKLLVAAVSAAVVFTGTSAARAQSDASYGQITPMSVSGSSTLKDKKHRYEAWRVFDGDWSGDPSEGTTYYTTGWCEGKKGEGVGEYLLVQGDDLSFTQLSIAAGYWKSDALFQKNNRPTKLTVIVTDHEGQEHPYDLDVPSGMEAAVLDVGDAPVDAMAIKIEIAAVAKGKIDDTCISNVSLTNGGRPIVPFLESGTALQELQYAVPALAEALSSCDAATLSSFVKFPLSFKSLPDPSGMVKPIKKKWKKVKDLLKSCAKGEAPAVPPDDVSWMSPDGAGGMVMIRAGSGNEAGSQWWHLAYEYDANPCGGGGGTWKLTSVDYR